MKVDQILKKIRHCATKQKRVVRTVVGMKLFFIPALSLFLLCEVIEATGNNIKSMNGYGKTLIPIL
jgi:hypothetical protein